jgi:hypothetical protein
LIVYAQSRGGWSSVTYSNPKTPMVQLRHGPFL